MKYIYSTLQWISNLICANSSYVQVLNWNCIFDIYWISIFTDARGGNHIPSSVGDVRSHWVDTALFKQNRVVFDTSPSPDKAKLKIFNVSESDDGLYRCRVDFKTSQTRTSRLNLTVVGKCVQSLIWYYPLWV